MIRWTGRLPRFSQTFVEERHDRSSREWRWSWRAVRRTWTNIDVDIWRVRRRHGAASTSHGRRIGNAISATVWNPITFFSVFVYYAHGRVIFHGETANLWRGEGPRRYGRTTKRGGGWDASSRQYPVCALVRIPGYQVSFKNCPKEFDIREMAARRACHGPALYTRSSKPRYYGVRRSFEIWMDASPIPPRKPYDSNFYSQIRTYYPCTLANDASKRDKYLEIHQRRYFSCQRKGKIFSLSRLRSKRVDTNPVDSFFDPSDFFPSWFTAVLPCIVLPSLLSLAPLGGFACGSSTVSLVE